MPPLSRLLLGDRGMIVRLTGVLNLEDFVDTSLAGNYGVEPAKSFVSVKS